MMNDLESLLKKKTPKGEFGVLASTFIYRDKKKNVVPTQIRDEIPTLNRMGYMKLDLDYFSHKFIDYAVNKEDKVLDLGCAYGFVVKKVLEKGGKIIASDLSEDHLNILARSCLENELNNLYLYPGKFPEEINFPSNSLGAVFTSRMFHFLNGNTIEQGLDKIYKWLKPGGKLFLIVVTPYNNAIKDGFLSIYQDRVNKNTKWPGVIENQWEINPSHKEYVEPYLHVFDKPQLKELLSERGFNIEEIELFDFPNEVSSDNKGHVGLIATKI